MTTKNLNLNKKLTKLINKVSDDQSLCFQYSIEHIQEELNKIYQSELKLQQELNSQSPELTYEVLMQWDKNDLAEYILDKI